MRWSGRIAAVVAPCFALTTAGCGDPETPILPTPAKSEAPDATASAKGKAAKKFIPRSAGKDDR